MKSWKNYALHIVESIEKIDRIRERGDLREDAVLYDAALRNLQTLSEAVHHVVEVELPELKAVVLEMLRSS